MKHFLFLVLMSITTLAFSQTPSMIVNSKEQSSVKANRALSLNNAWFGANVLMDIEGESIVPSAKFMYVPISGPRYAIPVLSNVSLSDSLDINNGLQLGLYPWFNLSTDDQFRMNLHGGVAYQFVPGDVENKFRMLAGFEISMYGEDDDTPISVSVAPEYIRTIKTNDDYFGLSVTGVVPVANRLGVMFDGSIPLDDSDKSTFKVGIVYIVANE